MDYIIPCRAIGDGYNEWSCEGWNGLFDKP